MRESVIQTVTGVINYISAVMSLVCENPVRDCDDFGDGESRDLGQ